MQIPNKIVVSYDASQSKFILDCPYMMRNVVRGLPNRRYVKRLKAWEAPALLRNAESIDSLRRGGQVIYEAGCQEIIDKVREKSSLVKKTGFSLAYKFKPKPFNHQLEALQQTYGLDQAALYMETGTGKSKIMIDTACSYYKDGHINAFLIVCPVTICSNWLEQLETHATVKYMDRVCSPSSKRKEREIEEYIYLRDTKKLKILVLGVESISQRKVMDSESKSKRHFKRSVASGKAYKLAEKFLRCHNVMMIVDEAHLIKNHDSNRSRNAVTLGPLAKKRMIATGTPIANGIMDLYMQFEFLSPHILGIGDYYSFRNRYAIMGGYEDKQIMGHKNIDELMDLIRPWIYQCTKEEVLPDLPDKLYTIRKVKINAAQHKMYAEVKKDRMADLPLLNLDGSNKELVVENILTLNLALQQIVSGFVTYASDEQKGRALEEIVDFKHNPKILEMLNVIDAHRGKSVIIWSRFRREINDIAQALASKYGDDSVAQYHGGIIGKDRDENERAFKAGEKLFFVANQATGGTGLTLNKANLTIYMSNDFNYVHRKQSEDRNHRIGQNDKVMYVDIVAEHTIDEEIAQAIENKQDMADFVKASLSLPAKPISLAIL